VKIALALTLLITGLLYCPSAFGESRATKIIRHGERVIRGRSTQALMTMKIVRPEYTRKLKLRSWTLGNHKALVEILDPRKEEGVASLRVRGNMWNYLPKVDQVVRVPTSLMLQSWMGSDFTNDDLMKASSLVRDYTHHMKGKDKVGKQKTLRILCKPRAGAAVVWGRIEYWARTSDYLPVQQKFYDEDGKWYRTISFSRFRKMDDRVVPTVVKVRTAENPKNLTVVAYQKLLYDRKIEASIFSKAHLRKNSQRATVVSAGWSFIPIGRYPTQARKVINIR